MELGRDRIRVCGLAPGLVDTPLTAQISAIPGVRDDYLEDIPLGRAGTVDDIASAALFLLSGDASWVSGTTLSVDGASNTKRHPEFMKIFSGLAQEGRRRGAGETT
jgi:NAD(P)-dependent dehydrogenase (short-subunit alcohol dehydrogenase family)